MSGRLAPHGLGRGLGALLGDIDSENEVLKSEQAAPGDAVIELSLSDIDLNPDQPRKRFDDEKLEELAQSIASVGVIQPIVVAKNGERYSVIVGERRFRASRLAGKSTIPAIVRSWDEMTRLKTALIENLQRADLNPIETALGLKALMDKCGLTQEQTAQVVGKSRAAVTNTLRLLNLDERVQAMVETGTLSAGHARALVPLSPERQFRLAELVRLKSLSVRDLERLAAQPEEPEKKPPKPPKTQEIKQLERMAREAFGAHARIDGDETKGRLIISYSSREDLESIWNILEALGQGEM